MIYYYVKITPLNKINNATMIIVSKFRIVIVYECNSIQTLVGTPVTFHPGLVCLARVVLTHDQIQTQLRPHFKNIQQSLAERTINRARLQLCRITPSLCDCLQLDVYIFAFQKFLFK